MLKKYSPQTTISENGIIRTEMVEEMLGAWIPANIGQEMYDAARNLEVAANTARYCYNRNPKNFAAALVSLDNAAEVMRSVLKEAEGGSDV